MTNTAPQTTPGPWYVHAPEPSLPFYIGTDPQNHQDGEVAVLYGKDSGANAKLIAAAPDLLAALEAMKDALAECEKWSLDQQIAYGKAHTAIVKARGI